MYQIIFLRKSSENVFVRVFYFFNFHSPKWATNSLTTDLSRCSISFSPWTKRRLLYQNLDLFFLHEHIRLEYD